MSRHGKRKCKSCGCTDFIKDIHSASSDLACQNCGRVFEENPIVSEVTFGETSNGAAMVQGAFVGADQSHATFGNGPRGNGMDSRTKTLTNAKRKIRAVASALKIPDYVADAAYQWFTLALTNNFVKGRRSQNVISACLYVACRKEKTHHMLIDFSTLLQVSLYSVGATFLKMVKALHITSLPLSDPSLFIQNFADKLEFGDDKVKIVKDAVKLAARMADDWIHEGRKPAGVAAACLLLAARMNNHRRTHAEIVAVAHVGEETLQRRLNDFKSTHNGELTIKAFRESEKVQETAPPSFIKNRKRDRKLMDDVVENNGSRDEFDSGKDTLVMRFISSVDLQSEEILEQLERVKRRQKADLNRTLSTKGDRHGVDKLIELEESREPESDEDDNEETRSQKKKQKMEDRELVDIQLVHIDKYIPEEDPNRPRNYHKLPKTSDILADIPDDPEDFGDLSDSELDFFILTEEESALKERVWTGVNEEFLLDEERKRLKAQADELSGNNANKKKNRKPKSVKIDGVNNADIDGALKEIGEGGAFSAAKTLLARKTQSKKINYMALNNLFDDN
ncbi:hypothetical protein WICPIJ_002786 [Wickerhamomyces pijperi]|uniref:B-related factor 1 n=1 Tax=Wickerhamomyces pijperi TaxID=599730 RepID=A0A9P8QB56_WICPI|nr:hypothetical protein WICPIJ_002786 [Wickerhamomyces pijperi]